MDMINFAIFSNFSIYFYLESSFVILTTLISILLFVIFAITGYFMMYFINKDSSIRYRISGLIVMSYVNNILVTVFAQQFFGSQVAALAAFYNIPYYIGIILLKVLFSTKVRIGNS
jgi:BASS family bile acid:Na+ symporter